MKITKENRELFELFEGLADLVNELLPSGVPPFETASLVVDREASKGCSEGEEVLRPYMELLSWDLENFGDYMHNKEAIAGVRALTRFLRNQAKGQAK
tara:strand:- start:942 stop:1235 length:294 start_codon:yes stop_codon:yes gene_type:complete